jgi:mannose-6-phosphate isomerase
MVDCPYFTTSYLPLKGSTAVSKEGSSFTVYICTEGKFTVEAEGEKYDFEKGDTVLIPASLKVYILSGEATLLEIGIS